jgi:hypothetical protein
MLSGTGGTAYDFDHPLYIVTDTDNTNNPQYTIIVDNEAEWGPSGIHGHTIRIPRYAKPAGYLQPKAPPEGSSGSGVMDAHMSILQRDGYVYDFWSASVPSGIGGTLNVNFGGRSLYNVSGRGVNSTAAEIAGFMGVLRWEEFRAGFIGHAIAVSTRAYNTRVYPSSGSSGTMSGVANDPPQGGRLRLKTTKYNSIMAGTAPTWVKTLAQCMRDYGLIIVDTGGNTSNGFSVLKESEAVYLTPSQTSLGVTFASEMGITGFNDPAVGGRTVYTWAIQTHFPTMNDFEVLAPSESQ